MTVSGERERAVFAFLATRPSLPFGLHLPRESGWSPTLELPLNVATVFYDDPGEVHADRWPGRRVAVAVTTVDDARRALDAGADVLVARGSECSGPVGSMGSFVLLQQILACTDVPVFLQGGVGLNGARAARVAGAAGVVLDGQLALVVESALDGEQRRTVAHMDGKAAAGLFSGHAPDVGSNGALAASLPAGLRSTGAVVGAFRSMQETARDVAAEAVFGAGSRFAVEHGLEVPILQGPMTRVSDSVDFAAVVAKAGALPFLALAVASGEEVERLLSAARSALGDAPWGVGILGFVPPDLAEVQLEQVLKARPEYAILAGGRPGGAARLEDAGIRTFLHAPSPTLLDMFIRSGARRFIFEGRECGGHVGPLPSMVLWELSIERLAQEEDLSDFDLVFAGGIHDGCSAAAVTAMAAPLVEAGARIGFLMGTAYLFTREAVTTGAIGLPYQDVARTCTGTVLLETSPGHAVRCVDTDYVREFETAKRRLVDAGSPQDEMWAELELLNLGRLRVASRGIDRDERGLVEIDESAQRRDGMFMMGEIASLRDEVLTVPDLHANLVDDAVARLAERQQTPEPMGPEPASDPLDIAIIGMASCFPGAPNGEVFWSNILDGFDAVTQVPEDRWDIDRYFDPTGDHALAGTRTPSKWGGFLPPVPFDALDYGIPPAALGSIETVQLLSLEVAAQALADAGYGDREFDRSHASVIFGAEAGTDLAQAYGLRSALPAYMGDIPADLDDHLPRLTEDSFPGLLTNIIAGRIANRLDLGGSNYTVDAACAASLAAVHLGCKELVDGSSSLVLCGGADLHNGINDYLLFSSVHALSPTGRCRTFDASADGIVLAEGVACVVLKRLADAERDGDRVYAVIKGIGAASDGRSLGLTAPRPEGQARALRRAYRQAGVAPREVGLVEAHGTGTVVGDRTELESLTDLFAADGAEVGSCVLGSVKSQIGHSKCAAGLAGLIKGAEAVYRGVQPPTINMETPNQVWDAASSPFRFQTRPRPWLGPKRTAGVSAFGFGGTNFHVVIGSHDLDESPRWGSDRWPAELFVVRGVTPEAAARTVSRLLDHAVRAGARDSELRIRDLATTAWSSGRGPIRYAFVASDLAELVTELTAIGDDPLRRAAEPMSDGAPIAYLFPGQGSQRPGMLSELFVTFPQLRRFLDGSGSWLDPMFPPAAFSAADRQHQLDAVTDTRRAQPMLGLAGLALVDLLSAGGITPMATAGHSYGELTALCVAGVISEDDLLALSVARGVAIVEAAGGEPGTMTAVAAAADEILPFLFGLDVVVANENAPRQSVISGSRSEIETAVTRLRAAGLATTALTVSCAFHSPVVAGARDRLTDLMAEIPIHPPKVPVWSNVTGRPHCGDEAELRARVAEQVASPVRFVQQIEDMYSAGHRLFVEVGPGQVLSRLVRQILGERPHHVVACDPGGRDGVSALLEAFAELARLGAAIDPTFLFDGRAEVIDLDAPVGHQSPWVLDGPFVRTRDGRSMPGGLQPAPSAPFAGLRADSLLGRDDHACGGEDAAAMVVADYLRNVQSVLDDQRAVVTTYLEGVQGAAISSEVARPVPTFSEPGSPNSHQSPLASPWEYDERTSGLTTTTSAMPSAASWSEPELRTAVTEVIADRTGYPAEMLAGHLDLEADLSIDSIKRIEILMALCERLGLTDSLEDQFDDLVLEGLVAHKTIDLIVEALEAVSPLVAAAVGPAASVGPAAGAVGALATTVDRSAVPLVAKTHLERFVPLAVTAEPVSGVTAAALAGFGVVLVHGAGAVDIDIASRLEARLHSGGASVRCVTGGALGPNELGGGAIVDLRGLGAGSAANIAQACFELLKVALASELRWTLVAGALVAETSPAAYELGVSALEAPSGAALRGLVLAASHEARGQALRMVELDSADGVDHMVELLVRELVDLVQLGPDKRCAHVAVRGSDRWRVELSGVPAPTASPFYLHSDAVVLLTGGTRGVTGRIAAEFVRRFGCRVAVLGRTAPVLDVERRVGSSEPGDLTAMRRRIAAAGVIDPLQIDADARAAMQVLEVQRTLDAIGGLDAFHQGDVRDEKTVRTVVEGLVERYGRLDLVVHGAGVVRDGWLTDKSATDFDEVFSTKVRGAENILRWVPENTLTVLFGSVSGLFGNAGQADYASANAALDGLAHVAVDAGRRVIAMDWGPWDGVGMVTAELAAEYRRRGVGLIDPEEGIECFFAELGQRSPQVAFIPSIGDPIEQLPAPVPGEAR